MERLVKRFTFPRGCSARSVTMQELTGEDDQVVATWMEMKGAKALGSHKPGTPEWMKASIELERRESIRRSIVSVDDKPVGLDGLPFPEFDTWSKKTLTAVMRFFNDLNGLEDADLEKCVAEATVVTSSRSAAGGLSVVEPTDV